MNWSQQHLGELIGVPHRPSPITKQRACVLRVPASLLPKLAQTFGVSVDDLLGVPKPASKRGPAPKLAQRMERISQLSKPKQRFVIQVLESVLAQQA